MPAKNLSLTYGHTVKIIDRELIFFFRTFLIVSELRGGQRQDFQIIVRKVVAALRQISSLHKSFFCRFGGKIVLEGYMYRDQNYLRYRDNNHTVN